MNQQLTYLQDTGVVANTITLTTTMNRHKLVPAIAFAYTTANQI